MVVLQLLVAKSHYRVGLWHSRLCDRCCDGYNILNEQAWTEYLNQDDPAIIETLRIFREGRAFPQPVTATEGQTIARAYDASILRLTGGRHLCHA